MEDPSSTDAILRDLIRSRRSLKPRLFNGQRIEDEVVRGLIEDACWAPTHGLTQPWRFHVFSDAALERLADFRQEWYRDNTPPEAFDPNKFDRLRENLVRTSHAILLCVHVDPDGPIPEIEEVEAAACAAQNLMLSAHAQGIQCFWGSGAETYTVENHAFLGLGPNERCLGTLYLGYSDRPAPKSKRLPVEQRLVWHR